MTVGIKRYKQLYNATAAGTGSWVELDIRYDKAPFRTLIFSVTAGDTLELQGITKDFKGIDETWLTSLTASEITSLKTYTASGNDVLEGPWTHIRVVKTGTAGNGLVEGFV